MTEVERVAVADLADELGTYRATVFKIMKRLSIRPTKQRDAARGGQLIALVTLPEASAIRTEFAAGRRTADQASANGMPLVADEGMFYLIQLEPAHDPGRFKVGFTTDLEGRLRHHRCSAPFAEYRKSWPCRRTWERAAIDCLTAGLDQLHTEVFRAGSLGQVLDRGDKFFSVMPAVGVIPGGEDEESATGAVPG